jgi:hypothetical protein
LLTYFATHEILGKDGEVAILLLELGRLFSERHVLVIVVVAVVVVAGSVFRVLIALALH